MGLIGLIIPMEGAGGSEDSHWPPGVHSFDPKPLFPDAGMDWLNTYLLQAVVGAIIVIVVWLWLAKDQKVVPGFKQWCGEQLYNMVRNGIGRDALGYEYKRFTPYLLALFSFILVNNLFGQFFLSMFPTFSRVGYAYGLALLTWLLYLGLGVVLWPVSRSAVTLVVGLGTLQMAAYTASNPALDLLTLARLHAAAAPDERAALAAAGEAVLARWNGTAFVTYYLLGAVVLLILAWLLRRSAAFSRATAAWALAAGVLMLVPSSFGTVGMVLALASLVPWSVLCVMAGRRLLGLAGCRLGIGRRDLPGPR